MEDTEKSVDEIEDSTYVPKCSRCGSDMKFAVATEAEITRDSERDDTNLFEWVICEECGYYEVFS